MFLKRKSKDQIPVVYFDEGTYGWLRAKDLTFLTPEDVERSLQGLQQKNADPRLVACYEQVSGGYTYEDFRNELGDAEENHLYDNIPKPERKRKSASPKSESADEGDTNEVKKRHRHQKFENKDHEVAWRFRYQLQKGLIQRKTPVEDKDIEAGSDTMALLEQFSKEGKVTVDVLRATKIHKVLREILKKDILSKKPYNLHDRSRKLLHLWVDLLEELRKDKQGADHSRMLSDAGN